MTLTDLANMCIASKTNSDEADCEIIMRLSETYWAKHPTLLILLLFYTVCSNHNNLTLE